jgi:hypothetical protein
MCFCCCETTAIGLDEFHQLLCLLCPDFPYTLVQNAARIDLRMKLGVSQVVIVIIRLFVCDSATLIPSLIFFAEWEKDPEFVKFGEFTQKLSLLFFYSGNLCVYFVLFGLIVLCTISLFLLITSLQCVQCGLQNS